MHQPLMGIWWQDQVFVDSASGFGLRLVPKMFSEVADFLAWVLVCEGVKYVIHYIDDLLIFVRPGSPLPVRSRFLAL